MSWMIDNFGVVWGLTVEHLILSLIPTILGLIFALPIGLAIRSRARARKIAIISASIVFTIPSLALFVIIPAVLGTKMLDPVNVVVALTMYSTALLIRTVVDSLDAVPADVRDAAEAIGYSVVGRAIKIDLPLAIPVLTAGVRVVAVTNVSLLSVGAVIGIGGLGDLFTAGYQRDYPDQILAGIIAILIMAFVLDRLIALLGTILTPWLAPKNVVLPVPDSADFALASSLEEGQHANVR